MQNLVFFFLKPIHCNSAFLGPQSLGGPPGEAALGMRLAPEQLSVSSQGGGVTLHIKYRAEIGGGVSATITVTARQGPLRCEWASWPLVATERVKSRKWLCVWNLGSGRDTNRNFRGHCWGLCLYFLSSLCVLAGTEGVGQ